MKVLKVDPIKNGTVIDHIPAGLAQRVLATLKPRVSDIVMMGMNFSSKVMGQKDIIKIEGRELTQNEVNSIALIAPEAKVSIIRDLKVAQKSKVEIPELIEGLVACGNAKCITNGEPMQTKFRLINAGKRELACQYCERVFNADELKHL
ncbi:MAG: aspartate carbamoyltransferase regulatory subunit [Candidatus Marinimicrobia bacterium]|nr:aspartate carbamoyltransferase regulatory subunit [Candidatus Neomarinimicrobiota bacterium]MCF7850153.1 aspartate carbamoyltransferase regulatory subunit [Candidatus Neomarinimicrobiota bacterium]